MRIYAERKWGDREFNCGDFVLEDSTIEATFFGKHIPSISYQGGVMVPTRLLKKLGQ